MVSNKRKHSCLAQQIVWVAQLVEHENVELEIQVRILVQVRIFSLKINNHNCKGAAWIPNFLHYKECLEFCMIFRHCSLIWQTANQKTEAKMRIKLNAHRISFSCLPMETIVTNIFLFNVLLSHNLKIIFNLNDSKMSVYLLAEKKKKGI